MSKAEDLMEQLLVEVEAARRLAAAGGGLSPMRQRGRQHDYEPEVESLSYIDFEDDDYRRVAFGEDADDRELEDFYVGSALAFLGEAEVFDPTDERVRGIAEQQLHTEYQAQAQGDGFWPWVIDVALMAGFDVYDSDTRTELFPAGTLCDYDSECCGLEIAMRAEHAEGNHEDTARGDCPVCAEITEDVGPEPEPEAEPTHRPAIVESLEESTPELRFVPVCSCGWESDFYYNLRWLAEQEAAAHGGVREPRSEAEPGRKAGPPEAEEDIYTCSGCGATLWCASMEHTLEDCESDCEFWVEDPRDQSAWCCAGSPGGECEGGSGCTMCGCQEAEAEHDPEAEQLAIEARLLAEQGSEAEAEVVRTEARLRAEQVGAVLAEAERQAEAERYAVVTADQGGYYVREVDGTLTDAVRMAREEGAAFGPAPGIVVKGEDGSWNPAAVATCTECFLPFEAEDLEVGNEDECPSCRAELSQAVAEAEAAEHFPFKAEGGSR